MKTDRIEIGKTCCLRILKQRDIGLYLDGDVLGEILLPKRYVPKNTTVGEYVEVFLYNDSDDRLIATTEKPYVETNECALLKVVDVNHAGAFMDWGLNKDLLVPHSEQNGRMEIGRHYMVMAYLDDESDRIAASAKLDELLSEVSVYFKPRQAVDLQVYSQTELGYKAVINHTHLGLLYKNEVFQTVKYGQKLKGYIKAIREDKKIDLSLQLPSAETRDALMHAILDYLVKEKGSSRLTDKSSPADIYQQFSVSKANYKKALGRLYKQKLIKIERHQVTLL
ncbi:MAG TPA: GntR family transcriptional regulator [Gammaproteobacteria bacterium]|nr:GntR family transcriptional regulator [Gammaproteobacteria bacterium]